MAKSIFQLKQEEELKKKVQSGEKITIAKPQKMSSSASQKWSESAVKVGNASNGQVAAASHRNRATPKQQKKSNERWYAGDKPTETEVLAKIADIGSKDAAHGRKLYSDYERAKQEGHWKETYDKATSTYMESLGLSEVNDDIVANYLQPLLVDAVHTPTGSVSTGKKNGSAALVASYASELIGEYNSTKGLLSDQDAVRSRIQYLNNKGWSYDEIKSDISARIDAGEYKSIAQAMKKGKEGGIVRTTAPVDILTSYGLDGMIWAAQNPNISTGSAFHDAIQRDMGRGKTVETDPVAAAKRDRGSAAWAPYSNGTTMDAEAIRFGVTEFAPDWAEKNRAAILASGDEGAIKAFGKVYEAEQFTRQAEEQAALFREEIENGIELGLSPDEVFYEGIFDDPEYSAINKLYEGYMTGMPAAVTRGIDFDLADMRKQAEDAYALKQAQQNAAKDPTAMQTAVEAEKQAQINANGSLINNDTIPISLTANSTSIFTRNPQKSFKQGLMWASAGITSGVSSLPADYGEWTDEQKMAAQGYVTDLKDGEDTSYAIDEMRMYGLSEDQINDFITRMGGSSEGYTAAEINAAIESGEPEVALEMLEADFQQKLEKTPELLTTDNAEKTAILALALAGEAGILTDPEQQERAANIAATVEASMALPKDGGGFYAWLDGVLNMNGALIAASENEGWGLNNTLMWAFDHTAFTVSGLVDKFIGYAIAGAGKLFGSEEMEQTGERWANDMDVTLAGHSDLLVQNGTPLEIIGGQGLSEIIKMSAFGKASQFLNAGTAIAFGEKFKWIARMVSSTPFALESSVREFDEAYKETEGDYMTSLLSGMAAFGATAIMSRFDGILKNIETNGMPYVREVVDALTAVPGAGVKATAARWGKAGTMWLWNLAKTCVNESVQEPAENIVTTFLTGIVKGKNPLDQDWKAYGKELLADAAMAFIISMGSSVSTMPTYANSVKVAEAQMHKTELTAQDVTDLVTAMQEDGADPLIQEEATQRAKDITVEVRTGELAAQGAAGDVDVTKVTDAEKKVEEASTVSQQATQEVVNANAKLSENPTDSQALSEFNTAVQKKSAADQQVQKAQEELTAAQAEVQEQSQVAMDAIRTQAAAEVEQSVAAIAQTHSDHEAAAEVQRQTDNETALDVDDFVTTMLPGQELSPDERAAIEKKLHDRKKMISANVSNAPGSANRARFVTQMQKKFGVTIRVMDTTQGGQHLRYNGAYDPKTGSIVIDSQATQSDVIYGVLLHELTHKAERSDTYQEFASAILRIKYGTNDKQLATDIKAKQDSYNSRLQAMKALDESVDATPLTADEASREIVADLTREVLFGDEASIQKLCAEKPSVAKRMLETINNFINKLRGVNDPAMDQLNKARELFEKALYSEASSKSDAKTQYHIVRTQGGGYVELDTDQDIFDGLDGDAQLKAARDYILSHFRNVYIGEGPARAHVSRETADEYHKPANRKKLSPEEREAKARVSTELDNLLTVSEFVKHEDDDGRHAQAVNGWDTYRAVFKIGDRWFSSTPLILKGKGYQRLYDVTHVKQIAAPYEDYSVDSETPRGYDDTMSVTEENAAVKQEIKTDDGDVAAEIIRDGVSKQYSLASWTDKEKETVRKSLLEKGYGPVDVDKWMGDVDSVASIISNDKARLDYEADPDQVMLKNNQEYVKTLDASTLCAKRLLYQGTFNEIQHLLPNTPLTSDMLLDLQNMMRDAGYETPCAVCYVESRRRHLGKFAEEWLHGREASKTQKAWAPYAGDYIPTLDELTTTDGLANLKQEHPKTYEDFMAKMRSLGSANPKIVELRTDYRGDIRKLTKGQIEKIVKIGGLRLQSFSDFETPHLIDMMQAVMDMSGKQLTAQAYTKVPNFAWVFGDTGIKINLSLMAEGDGLDENGNLVFSRTEGIDPDEAFKLRDRYSQNVGTIIVGVKEPHIRAAMADPRIDYIIPFHRSGWGENELKKVSVLQPYDDFQSTQNERLPDGGRPEGGNFYPIDYWDYSKTGDENAATYLRMCEEDGRIPKFDQFLTKDSEGHWVAPSGYWKLLIDFKMYDNDGNGAPQQAVQPNFNMEEAGRVLNEYQGGANTLPVAYDIVDKYVSEFKAAHPREQYSLPSETVLDEMVGSYLSQTVETEPQTSRPQGERQFAAQTMPNTEAVPEWIWREFQSNPDELNYDIDTNREQVERGWQRIQQNGHDAEMNRLMESDRFSADDTAEANLMMAMALRNDDPATFMALASKYNKEGTEAGKELQARKLFSKMTPTGARIWVAGKLENQLKDYMRKHGPMKEKTDRNSKVIADQIRGLDNTDVMRRLMSGEDVTIDSTNNRWGTPINQQQQALIDHYKLNKVARPGIFYNRATLKQRMLEAILATPNPLAVTGNGLNLIQRLEFMQEGAAVITNADIDYIGMRMGEFMGAGQEAGGRVADVAIARAYEAFGNITPATFGEKARTWRYISMLTSVPSAIRNVIGNASQNLVNATAHGIAVELDKIVANVTGARTAAHLSAGERVDGWKAFVEETKNTFRDYFVDKVATQRGNDKYNTNQRGRVYQSGLPEGLRNVEGFLMSFGDRNMWRKAYINSLAEQQKLADQNLLFNEDGTTRTHEQMIEQAELDANYATFTEDNQVSNLLSQLKRVPGVGIVVDYIMPFTGVPANITRRMIQYSPIGIATTALKWGYDAAKGKNFDQQAFVNGLSRGLTGTALFGVGILLAQMGAIKLGTGEEEDKKKYGLQTAMGQQYTPYIYNPITNEYVSLAVFSPAASAITMGGAAWMDFKDNDDVIQALQNAAFGSIDQIFDASYMTGLKDLFGGYGSIGENIVNSLFDTVVSQNVPTILGQLANTLDPYVRDTKDKNYIMQSLKSGLINKIPFLREQLLPEKVDVTGQTVRTKEGLRNFYDPFTTTDARQDPVVDELFRLNEALGTNTMLPSDALSGTKNALTLNKQTVTLDGKGKEAYRKRYGELWMEGGVTLDKKGRKKTVEGLRELMESRRYQRMSDEEKAEAIKDIIAEAKTGATMEAIRDYGPDKE